MVHVLTIALFDTYRSYKYVVTDQAMLESTFESTYGKIFFIFHSYTGAGTSHVSGHFRSDGGLLDGNYVYDFFLSDS